MVSAQRSSKRLRTARNGRSSGGGSGDQEPGPEASGLSSGKTRGPKSGASGAAAPKENGKQPWRHNDVGELSKLLEMPLDVLYEVSPGIVSVADDGIKIHFAFADIISCPSVGSTADVMDQ